MKWLICKFLVRIEQSGDTVYTLSGMAFHAPESTLKAVRIARMYYACWLLSSLSSAAPADGWQIYTAGVWGVRSL